MQVGRRPYTARWKQHRSCQCATSRGASRHAGRSSSWSPPFAPYCVCIAGFTGPDWPHLERERARRKSDHTARACIATSPHRPALRDQASARCAGWDPPLVLLFAVPCCAAIATPQAGDVPVMRSKSQGSCAAVYRWHATCRAGEAGRNRGSCSAQTASACGQRGRNRQPARGYSPSASSGSGSRG